MRATMTWNVINTGNKFVETTIEPTQAWKNTRTIDKKDKKINFELNGLMFIDEININSANEDFNK